jgi:hypothetical protein
MQYRQSGSWSHACISAQHFSLMQLKHSSSPLETISVSGHWLPLLAASEPSERPPSAPLLLPPSSLADDESQPLLRPMHNTTAATAIAIAFLIGMLLLFGYAPDAPVDDTPTARSTSIETERLRRSVV